MGGRSKGIKVQSIVEGFDHLNKLKNSFGSHYTFYKGMIEGFNRRMSINIERSLQDSYEKEVMITEVIIQYIMEGIILT